MRHTVILFCSAFGLILSASTAMAKNTVEKSPLVDCYVQSGPQTKADSLKISDDLLNKKLMQNPNSSEAFTTGFNLKYDVKAQKVSLSGDQEFQDMAMTEDDVIVQMGRYNGEVYVTIDTRLGSSYARSVPADGSNIFVQHVNTIAGNYADLRVTCTYHK